MICKNKECQTQLPDDAVYCLKCGTRQDIQECAKSTVSIEIENNEDNKSKYNISDKAKRNIGIGVVVAVAICIFCLIGSYSNKNTTPSYTEPTTTIVPTTTVEDNEYPLSECPIRILDTYIEKTTEPDGIDLSIKCSYETHKGIDKIAFYAVPNYTDEGYGNTRRFTYEGPFSYGDVETIVFEQAWLSDKIEHIGITEIRVYYSENDLIEYYANKGYCILSTEATETTEATEPTTAPKPKTLQDCPIKVNSCYTAEPNSAGGVDLYVDWYCESDKEIKYIYFNVTPYNRVNDFQRCEIRDYGTQDCKLTGPFNNDSADYSYWECVWYNDDIDHPELNKITIEYMDGTKETYYNK